jgi:2-keto-4-pentenoate hydratase/2-oxohepta-3-ene-1,7-dioic acid hydratase in catechol pathway
VRIANLAGRLIVDNGSGFVDAHDASDRRFAADPQAVYGRWGEFFDWAAGASLGAGVEIELDRLGPPVPRPRQVFAVALNYAEHAAEGGFSKPDRPLIFTKFPSCLAGPVVDVALATPFVDWEVELVAVIGHRAERIAAAEAWDHVAGLMIGQDLSARDVQQAGPAPQYSLGKSFPAFGPTGPWVVTTDAPGLTGELELECRRNGERVQHDLTSSMIFSVSELIAYISAVCPLLPGDLLFTGTPSGVGSRRDPPIYLQAGDELVSRITGIGEIRQTFRDAGPSRPLTPTDGSAR